MKKTVLTAVISVAATLLAVFLVIFLKNSAPKYPFKDLKVENVKAVYYTYSEGSEAAITDGELSAEEIKTLVPILNEIGVKKENAEFQTAVGEGYFRFFVKTADGKTNEVELYEYENSNVWLINHAPYDADDADYVTQYKSFTEGLK